MWNGVIARFRSASMTRASTSAWLYVFTTSFVIEFVIEVVSSVAVAARFDTALTLRADFRFLTAAQAHAFHFFLRCLNPPNRTFFFGWTRWMVFMARRANPCARRIARRRARGFVTRMRRTHLPVRGLMCLHFRWPPSIREPAAPPSAPIAPAAPAAESTG